MAAAAEEPAEGPSLSSVEALTDCCIVASRTEPEVFAVVTSSAAFDCTPEASRSTGTPEAQPYRGEGEAPECPPPPPGPLYTLHSVLLI